MEFNRSIIIDNVVVSSDLRGTLRFVPISLTPKFGIDCSDLQRRTYGTRVDDNEMISNLIHGTFTFKDALDAGREV
jgi:hypothetical protein